MQMIKSTEFNPSRPGKEEQFLQEMDSTLLPLREYCEQYKVTKAIDLEAAPRHIQMLLKIHWLRPEILKYLKWRQH